MYYICTYKNICICYELFFLQQWRLSTMNYLRKWVEQVFPVSAQFSISVSKTITQQEWENVYEETLSLAQQLDLCYVKNFDYEGVIGKCFAPPEELDKDDYDIKRTLWRAEGLYSKRIGINTVKFIKYLKKENCEQSEGSAFLGYAYNDESLSSIMMGQELINESYITSILALAFLIEARLKDKAFVYGCFDYYLAQEALKKINMLLKEPIEMPAVCKADKLMEYVNTTNFSKSKKFKLFTDTFAGPINQAFWNELEANFSKTTITKFKKKNSSKLQKKDKKNETMKSKSVFDEDSERKYDIEFTDELFDFKNGDTINPELLDQILGCYDVFKEARKQSGYAYLSTMLPLEQIKRLARQKEFIPLKDVEWQHVINYFKTESDALERYYPLVMVSYELYSPTCHVACSLFINDELYFYCRDKYLEKENTDII